MLNGHEAKRCRSNWVEWFNVFFIVLFCFLCRVNVVFFSPLDCVSVTWCGCECVLGWMERVQGDEHGGRYGISSRNGMYDTHLCTNAIKSAARPEPSHTTTGTGGVSVTYSNTARIVFVPPSITKHTTGVLEWVTVNEKLLIGHFRRGRARMEKRELMLSNWLTGLETGQRIGIIQQLIDIWHWAITFDQHNCFIVIDYSPSGINLLEKFFLFPNSNSGPN